jgi:fucose 4-O-acetylase-like acetyltransferase
MGVNLIALWGFTKAGQGFQTASRPLVAFGSAPLFVYVLHLYLFMLMGNQFAPSGTSLPIMYLYWLAGLAILYLPALWYGRFKGGRSPASIWRFL